MTDQEWLAYLDRLAAIAAPTGAEIAETLGALMERINTIVVTYVNREHDDTQSLARRLDLVRDAIADLRTVIQDHHQRLAEREAGDGR